MLRRSFSKLTWPSRGLIPYIFTMRARELARLAQIVVRAGRHLVVDQLFGDAAAQQRRDLVLQLALRHQEAVLRRRLQRVAQRRDAARDDRDLLDAFARRAGQRHDRVPQLVMGDALLLGGGQHAVLLLEPRHDALDRLLQLGHPDLFTLAPHAQQRRLVDDVGQVGARRTRPSCSRSPRGRGPTRWGRSRACSLRIARRAVRSGRSTSTWRSKRPARSSAGSRISGRFVAAIRMTPTRGSNPSSSTSS